MVWYKPKNSKGLSTRPSKPGISDFLPLNDSHTECSAVPILLKTHMNSDTRYSRIVYKQLSKNLPLPAKFVPEISKDMRFGRHLTISANVLFSSL